MALSEFERHRYEKLLQDFCRKEGPPPHLQDRVRWGYGVDPERQTVELFEIRPRFLDPSQKRRIPIARARYVKTRKDWRVYWMRANGKWVPYDPCPFLRSLEEFLKLVKEDAFCCFFG